MTSGGTEELRYSGELPRVSGAASAACPQAASARKAVQRSTLIEGFMFFSPEDPRLSRDRNQEHFLQIDLRRGVCSPRPRGDAYVDIGVAGLGAAVLRDAGGAARGARQPAHELVEVARLLGDAGNRQRVGKGS